jgi:hypothetical protein
VTRRQKVLLIGCLVLVVVLYAVAVGGGRAGSGDAAGHHGFVSWLGGLGGGRSTVAPQAVTGDCVRPDHTVTLTAPCVLHVADPGSLKNVLLRSSTGFTVTAPAPGSAHYSASSTVKPDEHGVAETKVAVDKAADITVACAGTPSCVLTIAAK